MQYENLNIDVLKTTLGLLFGDKAFDMARRTYTAIAAGMESAHAAGFEAGRAARNIGKAITLGDDGALRTIEQKVSFDDNVEELFAADAEALNGEYDASNVQDSGDVG